MFRGAAGPRRPRSALSNDESNWVQCPGPARLAQLVEHLSCEEDVTGSIPVSGSERIALVLLSDRFQNAMVKQGDVPLQIVDRQTRLSLLPYSTRPSVPR